MFFIVARAQTSTAVRRWLQLPLAQSSSPTWPLLPSPLHHHNTGPCFKGVLNTPDSTTISTAIHVCTCVQQNTTHAQPSPFAPSHRPLRLLRLNRTYLLMIKFARESPPNAATAIAKLQPSASDEVACVPETGWNRSIWNPHVFESAAGTGATAVIGGAAMRFVSPREEVLRQQAVALVFSRFQARTGNVRSSSCDAYTYILPVASLFLVLGLEKSVFFRPNLFFSEGSLFFENTVCARCRPTPLSVPLPLSPSLCMDVRLQVLGKELGVRLKNEMFERWQVHFEFLVCLFPFSLRFVCCCCCWSSWWSWSWS